MWHSISMHSKVRHLKEIYPHILEVALFTGKDPGGTSYQVSKGSTSQHATTSESPSGLSINSSSSQITSDNADTSQDDTPMGNIPSENPHILGSIRKFALRELSLAKGPLTPSITLDILHSLVRSENLNEMLSFFMSQLLIRTGTATPCRSDR